jgi:hypothetical protein
MDRSLASSEAVVSDNLSKMVFEKRLVSHFLIIAGNEPQATLFLTQRSSY